MTRDEAKDHINAQEPTFLQRAKTKGYICPECANGSGNSGTGITLHKGHYKCFKCDLNADVIDLYGRANGITDFTAQLEAAAQYYGVTIDNAAPMSKAQTAAKPKSGEEAATRQDYTEYINACKNRIADPAAVAYLKGRGITGETAKRFNIGYDAKERRVIIPITKHFYIARAVDPENEIRYKNPKGAETAIFNRAALTDSKKPVFIVEGAFDALSIIEAGGEAVALNSTSNAKKLIDFIQYNAEKVTQPLIIALDNDSAGAEKAPELESAFSALEIPFITYNPAGAHKDANEALQADREALRAAITEGERQAIDAMRAEIRADSAAEHLQAFINGISENANITAISTGFKKLDKIFDGGLYEGLYIIGALPSLGKTAYIMQIADQIAQQGQDVIVFALEMSRFELMARSISRITAQLTIESGGKMKNAKTARGILQGSRYAGYSTDEKQLINDAIETYGEYAEHLYIIEGIGDIGINQICDRVKKHITITGKRPVVIVDYLQILAPYDVKASDKQNTDKAVLELKRMSREYKLSVIAISAFNRENYQTAVSMKAFKESGAIEYGSDVLIGLQYEGAEEKNFDIKSARAKSPRRIELSLLKNRNGSTDGVIAYDYHPMFNYFSNEEIKPQEDTRKTKVI